MSTFPPALRKMSPKSKLRKIVMPNRAASAVVSLVGVIERG